MGVIWLHQSKCPASGACWSYHDSRPKAQPSKPLITVYACNWRFVKTDVTFVAIMVYAQFAHSNHSCSLCYLKTFAPLRYLFESLFRSIPTLVDPPGIEPGSPVCRNGVVPLDHEPAKVRGVGIEPTVSSFQGWRITAFLPPEWTARDLHPHFRRAEPASSCWTSSPHDRNQGSGIRSHHPTRLLADS